MPTSSDSATTFSTDHDRPRDIRRVAKILRDGGYTYDPSKHQTAEARKEVGLTPPKPKKGSVDRLTAEEIDRLLTAAYEKSARQGLMLRTLLETGMRVSSSPSLRPGRLRFGSGRSASAGKEERPGTSPSCRAW